MVWALPCSLAATWGISFDYFSSGYLDVSVHRVRSLSGDGISPAGLPHSEIHGSLPACGLPWLFAACCVLLRPQTPRHPPCAFFGLAFLRLACFLWIPKMLKVSFGYFCILFLCVVFRVQVVGPNRLELLASRLSGVRSNRLSYGPLVETRRFELLTPCLQGRCSPI